MTTQTERDVYELKFLVREAIRLSHRSIIYMDSAIFWAKTSITDLRDENEERMLLAAECCITCATIAFVTAVQAENMLTGVNK